MLLNQGRKPVIRSRNSRTTECGAKQLPIVWRCALHPLRFHGGRHWVRLQTVGRRICPFFVRDDVIS
jgi:hypothetical protein